MKKFIANHPAFTHAEAIKSICKPLEQLGINYFSHISVTKSHEFSAICCNPDFAEHYLNNGYFNADLHMSKLQNLGNYIIWDLIERKGDSLKMHDAASQFGVIHTFTIVKPSADKVDYYHFSSDSSDSSINQMYLSNIDKLELFILYFNDKINASKQLSKAYDLTISLDAINGNYATTEPQANAIHFLDPAEVNRFTVDRNTSLSSREFQVLMWLHLGKTLDEVAIITDISRSTVVKHVNNVKQKLGCYTLFQLGERFANHFQDTLKFFTHQL